MGLTNFKNGITSFGVPTFGSLGIGNVYFISRTTSSAQSALFTKRYGATRFDDGTKMLWQDAADGVQLQAAITASQGGFNNYFIVAPGQYTLSAAALTLSGKSNSHLIACNQADYGSGAPGSSAIQQSGSFVVLTMEAYCEVSGFQFINKAGYAAVSVPANIWRPSIHHNCFHMVAGSACNIVDATGSLACSHGNISNNRFSNWVGGNLTSAISVGTGVGVVIKGNVISQCNGTMDYGITQAGTQCIVQDNVVSNCGGGGVVTVAVNIHAYSSAIGNRLSVDAGRALSGGTAANSFVDNMDGATGAGNGAASNLET